MEKTIIILSLLTLITSSCEQTKKKQPAENKIAKDSAYLKTLFVDITKKDIQENHIQGYVDTIVSVNTESFEIIKIDSTEYFSLEKKVTTQKPSLEKITDLKQVKQILKGVVIFNNTDEYGTMTLSKIIFRNGKTYSSQDGDWMVFVAYYPQEDIILLEGGHTTDISFNLTSGEDTDIAGNPDYVVFSQSGKYRLNGYFGGQECSHYFIQKKTDEGYQKFIQLDSEFEEKTGTWLCRIIDKFWQDDTVFNFITTKPDSTRQNEIKFYYQVIFK